jgi:hypothetical protein
MRRCQIVRVKLLLYPALGLSFFGSLLLAAHFFPRPYQWRWDVMSKLAEPKFNPHAYLIACGGLAVSGLLLAAFPASWRRVRRAGAEYSSISRRFSSRFPGLFPAM